MAKFKIYKLRFTTPLHLGDERADYDTSLSVYHSDSMYAAITAVLAKIGIQIPDNGDFGFSISSLFPYYQKDNDTIFFLPKPLKQDDFDPEIRKIVKKIEWLDIKYFNKYINGENLFANGFNKKSSHGSYMTDMDIDDGFISKEVNPRVTVSRTGQEDARPFYMERLYFKYDSGMYFIALGDNFDILENALEILKDEGIGTDRTVGNGFFEWESDKIEINIPESEYFTNLSMFIPVNKEQLQNMLNSQNTAYRFQKRGGWITDEGLNTFRKNNIYMFNEGSVFKTSKTNDFSTNGRIVNLMPDLTYEHLREEKGIEKHPVWRNGKAIFIPVKINN